MTTDTAAPAIPAQRVPVRPGDLRPGDLLDPLDNLFLAAHPRGLVVASVAPSGNAVAVHGRTGPPVILGRNASVTARRTA